MRSLLKSGNKNEKGRKIPIVSEIHEKKYPKVINYFFVALISIFLIIIPFYRGLYFRENYIPAIAYVSIVFILYIVKKLIQKDYNIITSYLDIAILLLPIAYLISFFFAINLLNAFDMILKYAAYFMIYKIVADICKEDKKQKKLLSWFILFSIYLVAISGMLTMAGLLKLNGVTMYNRLYGAYQYPNTTAAVLGAGMLIAMGLLRQTSKTVERLFYQVVLTTLFAAFVFTLSLGGFLVFCLLVLFGFLIADAKGKIEYLATFIFMLAGNAILFVDYMKNALKGPFVLYYLLSLAINIIFQYLYVRYILNRISKLNSRRVTITIIATLVLAVIMGIVTLSALGISLPALVSKLFNYDLKAQNASDRIIFLKDGLKMFADNFIVGLGGGGWQDAYYKYQSFPYDSKEIHNYYVQLMVETGMLGTISLLIVLVLLLKDFIVRVFMNKDHAILPYYLGAFMLLGHAWIDFDLSLVAPMMLLWCLIGLIESKAERESVITSKLKSTTPVLVILAIFVLYLSLSTYSGIQYGRNAAQKIKDNMQEATVLFEKAMRLDRYNAAYRMDYAQIMLTKLNETKDVAYHSRFRESMEEIARYEPYNVKYIFYRISLLLSGGLINEGAATANNLVKNMPLVEAAYETKIDVNYNIAKEYFRIRQHEKAIPYLDSMIEVESELKAVKNKSIKPFEVNKRVYDMIGLAKNWKENAENMKKVSNYRDFR